MDSRSRRLRRPLTARADDENLWDGVNLRLSYEFNLPDELADSLIERLNAAGATLTAKSNHLCAQRPRWA